MYESYRICNPNLRDAFHRVQSLYSVAHFAHHTNNFPLLPLLHKSTRFQDACGLKQEEPLHFASGYTQFAMATRPRLQPRSAASTTPRSSRHAAHPISYRESSSENDEELEAEADYEPTRVPKRAKMSSNATSARLHRHPPPARDHSDSDEQILYEQFPRKRQLPPISRTSPIKKAMPKPGPVVDVDQYSAGVIPQWQTLPYQILLQIFHFASSPLVDERTFNQTANWNWLLQTSKLCRAFSEPALTVLYRSPCLTPMDRAHTYEIQIPYATSAKIANCVQPLRLIESRPITYVVQLPI